jgi:hypothetical protein
MRPKQKDKNFHAFILAGTEKLLTGRYFHPMIKRQMNEERRFQNPEGFEIAGGKIFIGIDTREEHNALLE